MAVAAAAGSEIVASWDGRAVKAETVAAQMLALRKGAFDEEGYPLARASVMNLIVYSSEVERMSEAVSIVDDLAMRHPARSIVVDSIPAEGFSLDAEVALRRHPLATHGLVYERAVLHAHGADPEGLDTLVIPLLIPHLQSFLWWLGDPNVEDPALKSLGAICDRLVVDTALGRVERLRDLSMVVGGTTTPAGPASALSRLVVGDVAWSRLDSLRRALVQIFDEGHRAEYLEGVTALEIRGHRGLRTPVSPAEALFAGWIASRLGWSLPAWAAGGVSMRHGQQRVMLLMSGTRGSRPAGGSPPLQGFSLQAQAGRRKLSVDLTTARGEAEVTIAETSAGTVRRTIPLPVMTETEALSREFARLGRDRVYEDAMISAARIIAAIDS